jgi:hypothetical protein
MRIQANTISLMGSLGCMFWYAVYTLALFYIFVSRTWLAIKDSNGSVEKQKTGSNFAVNQN